MASTIEICCGVCGIKVKASYLFRHHQRHHSENVQKFSCIPCSKEYLAKSRFDEHMKVYHSTSLTLVMCDACEKTFKSEQRLQEHKSYKHTIAPISFACLNCKKLFDNEKVYKKHLQKLHLDLPCNECEKKLGSTNALRYHKKTKHSDKEVG